MNFVKQTQTTYNFNPATVVLETDILPCPSFAEEFNELNLTTVLTTNKLKTNPENKNRLNPYYGKPKPLAAQKQAVQTAANIFSGLSVLNGGLTLFNQTVKNMAVKQTITKHNSQVYALTEITKGLIKQLSGNPNINIATEKINPPQTLTDLISVAIFVNTEICNLNSMVDISQINKQLSHQQAVLTNLTLNLLNLKN